MSERPILFSGEMVRAILDGRKTQTRRVVKPQPVDDEYPPVFHDKWQTWSCPHLRNFACPYGTAGDRLWVRETWAVHDVLYDDLKPSEIHCTSLNGCWEEGDSIWYRADGNNCRPYVGKCEANQRGKWRPSIFMPRWASRITLLVKQVRVERVQEITEEDARAEGVQLMVSEDMHPLVRVSGKHPPSDYCESRRKDESLDDMLKRVWTYRTHFASLWDEINAKRGFPWESNPWVFVIDFERCEE